MFEFLYFYNTIGLISLIFYMDISRISQRVSHIMSHICITFLASKIKSNMSFQTQTKHGENNRRATFELIHFFT